MEKAKDIFGEQLKNNIKQIESNKKSINIDDKLQNSGAAETTVEMQNQMNLMPDGVWDTTKELTEILPKHDKVFFNEVEIKEPFSILLSEFVKMNEITRNMANILEPLQRQLRSFANAFSDLAISIQIPEISEEQKERWIASSRVWGSMGWSYSPNIGFDLFFETPKNYEDANAKMEPYCTEGNIQVVFDSLKQYEDINEDVESAVFCYENGQYKACVLMLFELIDGKLIRQQDATGKRRPTGTRAAEKIKNNFEQNVEKSYFYLLLRYTNLFECMETIFEGRKDFENEPPNINRNFVSHGMMTRSVTKMDCIQLFFVLEN